MYVYEKSRGMADIAFQRVKSKGLKCETVDDVWLDPGFCFTVTRFTILRGILDAFFYLIFWAVLRRTRQHEGDLST